MSCFHSFYFPLNNSVYFQQQTHNIGFRMSNIHKECFEKTVASIYPDKMSNCKIPLEIT